MIEAKSRLNLCKALTNCICDTKPDSPLEIDINLARRSSVTSLLYPIIDYVDDEKKGAIQSMAEQSVNRFYKMSYIARYLQKILMDNGIISILLKGPATAAYYPVPEYRAFGDIDLLLYDPNDYDKADKLFGEQGIRRTATQDSHHHTSYLYDNVCIELHRKVVREFAQKKVNERIDSIFTLEERNICRKKILGCEYTVLKPELELLYMTLHMIEHLCNAGFGIKLLCDYVAALNGNSEEDTVSQYRGYIDMLGLNTFVLRMSDICVAYLGLSEPVYKQLTGKSANTELILNDHTVDELLNEIFDTGLFGSDNSSRIVALNENGIIGLIKEFHHQTKENFPKASKCPLTWPGLWIATFVIFVRNNKKIRGIGMLDVIREADRRGQIIGKMNLFKN